MLPKIMKAVLVFLVLVSVGSGIKYNGLRARFALTGRVGTKEYFSIPRTLIEAKVEGWVLTERPKGRVQQLPLYCYPGRIVCALYSEAGFIAGLQIAIPVEYIDSALRPEEYFIKWSPPAVEGQEKKVYWSATQYYVTEETIKSGKPTPAIESTLQAGAVWVNDVDGSLLKISVSEKEIQPPYRKQRCVSKMGLHYYYNITTEFDCKSVFLPWFVMFANGKMTGVGFQTFGSHPAVPEDGREWFEDVPRKREATTYSMIDASECLKDYNANYGSLSLHIYYVDEPWDITCENGVASIKQ